MISKNYLKGYKFYMLLMNRSMYTHSLPLLNSCILLRTEKRCSVANHQGNNIKVSMEATPAANGL